MKRVYISGPITSSGNMVENERNAILAGDELARHGYAVFIPHLNAHWQAVVGRHENDYEFWMRQDYEWVKVSDAVLRLPGVSHGADREVAFAEGAGIPVFESQYELRRHFEPLLESRLWGLGTIHFPRYENLTAQAEAKPHG